MPYNNRKEMMKTNTYPIKRALISVSDKTGLDLLAHKLHHYGVELVASGGTAKYLEECKLPFIEATKLTGNPEAFGGRMKTLSFQILSGLLYRRDHDQDCREALELGIQAIDLVVCHLYPFDEVVKLRGELDELIENIDIGGPSMLRAAAKNYASVLVCPSPDYYQEVLNELDDYKGQTTVEFRRKMALRTFRHTAHYDGLITRELEERFEDEHHSSFLSTAYAKSLRYGENPQQTAFVQTLDSTRPSLANAEILQGKELSYNNMWDADQAFRALRDIKTIGVGLDRFGAVVVKHANPAGVALASNQRRALELAWNGDPVSAFGSIIALSSIVDGETAEFLDEKFVEVIIAPDYSAEALARFSKKKNLRLIKKAIDQMDREWVFRSIDGGALIQGEDPTPRETWSWKGRPSEFISEDLVQFGIAVTKHLRSNGIALVHELSRDEFQLIGAGMGNPNRLVSIEQAYQKARDNGVSDFSRLLLVSDAFFPFSDNIELASSYGVTHFVQPGGSIRDEEVIKAVEKIGGAMALTGVRHFRH
jgi:phosphoribosylaminoimidazolecarboxamide formyltransferase / IMP cyclohydrolase